MRKNTAMRALVAYLLLFAVDNFLLASTIHQKQLSLDVHGVVKASKIANGGKINALKEAFRKNKYFPLFSSADYFIRFKLSSSKKEAIECFNQIDDQTITYLIVHAVCGLMISRIYYVNGEYSRWAHLNFDMKKELTPLVWKRSPSSRGHQIGPFDAVDFPKFFDWPASSVKKNGDSIHSTPVTWKKFFEKKDNDPQQTVPFIKIKVNGSPVDALLDTGAAGLVIPERYASMLHIRNVSALNHGLSTAYKHVTHATVAKVKSMDIVGFHFTNVMATVAKTPHVIVGLLPLLRLKKILIYQNKLTVLSGEKNQPPCDKKMYLGGYLSGFLSAIRLTTTINGNVEHPFLDTGLNDTFHKTVHFILNGRARNLSFYDAAGDNKLSGYRTTVRMGSSNHPVAINGTVILDRNNPIRYVLGSQMIKKLGPLYLDFDSGHGCFL